MQLSDILNQTADFNPSPGNSASTSTKQRAPRPHWARPYSAASRTRPPHTRKVCKVSADC